MSAEGFAFGLRKSITDFSEVTTVGLDLAKHIFQVHGVDRVGTPLSWPSRSGEASCWNSSLSLPPCLVGLEACGSAHHWARELISLGMTRGLMPPAYVKPYGAPAERTTRRTPRQFAKR